MDKLKDAFEILFLMGLKEWRETLAVPGLADIDRRLILQYFWRFPSLYIGRERKGLPYPYGNFLYGETPYYTAREIAQTAGINKNDIVYDLGCGRGKFLFFVKCLTRARCFGLDLIPTYIDIAQKITDDLRIRDLFFYQEDILEVDLETASVVFINGTYFSPETHEVLKENLSRLRPGARVISSSIPCETPILELFAKKNLLFSWAGTPVYFYRVKEREG